MKLYLAITVVFGLALACEAVDLHKRRLDQFGAMIQVTTGKGAFDFNNYGRWCGFGGSGDPTDEIDACCKTHDQCYHVINRKECRLEKAKSLTIGAYLTGYKWTNSNGKITCEETDTKSCEYKLCMCDKEGAECFGKHSHKYNDKNKFTFADKIMGALGNLFG